MGFVATEVAGTVQPKTKLYNHLGFQFSDYQLRSFVDPKPVELRKSYIEQADGKDIVSGRGLKIIGQRLNFDNYLDKVCVTTIKQILFNAI